MINTNFNQLAGQKFALVGENRLNELLEVKKSPSVGKIDIKRTNPIYYNIHKSTFNISKRAEKPVFNANFTPLLIIINLITYISVLTGAIK